MANQPSAPDPGFDQEALAALDAIFRFAYHLAGDQTEAEDLVQETYARAYANKHQYTRGTNCTAWLCAICRNVFLRQRSRGSREPAVTDPELESLAATAVHVAAQTYGLEADAFQAPDFSDALQRGLKKIPEVYRSAVVLVDIEDLNYVDAANVLDIPLGTLRSRLFRGRRLLQQELLHHAIDLGLITAQAEEAR